MKKITRMSLQELAKEMPVLSDAEQSAFIGGDRIIFDNSGHYLRTEVDDNTYDTIKIDGTNSGHILDASTTFSSYSYEDDNKNVATGFMFSGASIGLFEFFAQGTEVEWAYSYNEKKKGNQMECYIQLIKQTRFTENFILVLIHMSTVILIIILGIHLKICK